MCGLGPHRSTSRCHHRQEALQPGVDILAQMNPDGTPSPTLQDL
jgi:hypothetical protein